MNPGSVIRPRRWTQALLLLACLAALVPATPAAAQRRAQSAKQEPKSSENPAYRAAIDEALSEFDRGNWDEALALFRRAHAIEPNARTLRGIGFCLFEIRQYVAATRHLEQAMADTRSPLSPAQRSSTQQVLDRAAAFVAHVSVTLSPVDARLLVDGQEVPADASGALQLDPGEHELSASAPGHSPRVLRVSVQSGRNDPIQLELTPDAAGPEPVAVQAPAPAGDVAPSTTDRTALKRNLMISGFSVAGAGIVVGTVLGVITLTRKDDLEKNCPGNECPPAEADRLDSAKGLALGSTLSLAIAGAGAVVGLTGLLLPKADKRTANARGWKLSAGLRSVTLTGRF